MHSIYEIEKGILKKNVTKMNLRWFLSSKIKVKIIVTMEVSRLHIFKIEIEKISWCYWVNDCLLVDVQLILLWFFLLYKSLYVIKNEFRHYLSIYQTMEFTRVECMQFNFEDKQTTLVPLLKIMFKQVVNGKCKVNILFATFFSMKFFLWKNWGMN